MRPTFAEINLHAINENLRQVKKRVGKATKVMAVVKANAYGHGMIPVAKSVLKHNTAEYLGVAIVEEGIALRQARITAPTMVFTAPFVEQLNSYVQNNLEATLCSIDIAKKLNHLAEKAGRITSVHIKVDTGMGRIGIAPHDAMNFIREVSALKNIFIKGIYTHFATSDERETSFAKKQLSEFQSLVQALDVAHISIPLKHCANSGAIMQMKDSYFDMVRPGIMMYGYTPSLETRNTIPLAQAMSLKSKISFLKKVKKNTSISYSRRYITSMSIQIASVPVGYADGVSRRLTGKAQAIVGGKKRIIAGTICMDQLMIDLGRSPDVAVGEEVVLIGSQGASCITAWDVAAKLETIPYEICCAITERVPRKYIYE